MPNRCVKLDTRYAIHVHAYARAWKGGGSLLPRSRVAGFIGWFELVDSDEKHTLRKIIPAMPCSPSKIRCSELAVALVRYDYIASVIVNPIKRFCSLLCRASALRVLKSRD